MEQLSKSQVIWRRRRLVPGAISLQSARKQSYLTLSTQVTITWKDRPIMKAPRGAVGRQYSMTLQHTFVKSSCVTAASILERFHETFWPLKKKKVKQWLRRFFFAQIQGHSKMFCWFPELFYLDFVPLQPLQMFSTCLILLLCLSQRANPLRFHSASTESLSDHWRKSLQRTADGVCWVFNRVYHYFSHLNFKQGQVLYSQDSLIAQITHWCVSSSDHSCGHWAVNSG